MGLADQGWWLWASQRSGSCHPGNAPQPHPLVPILGVCGLLREGQGTQSRKCQLEEVDEKKCVTPNVRTSNPDPLVNYLSCCSRFQKS